jgi:hypothetical protein
MRVSIGFDIDVDHWEWDYVVEVVGACKRGSPARHAADRTSYPSKQQLVLQLMAAAAQGGRTAASRLEQAQTLSAPAVLDGAE